MKTTRRLIVAAAALVLLACLGLALAQVALPTWLIASAALASAGVLIVSAVSEVESWKLPEPEDPPVPSEPIRPRMPQPLRDDPVLRAERKLRDAEDFAQRVNGKHKIQVESDHDDDAPPPPAPRPPRPPYGGTPR